MEFAAKIRKQSESIIITIPNEIVKLLGIQEGTIKRFDLIDEPDKIDEKAEKEFDRVVKGDE